MSHIPLTATVEHVGHGAIRATNYRSDGMTVDELQRHGLPSVKKVSFNKVQVDCPIDEENPNTSSYATFIVKR